MATKNFRSTYLDLSDHFYELIEPVGFKDASLLAFNEELAKDLGLGNLSEEQIVSYFSGNENLPEAQPLAIAYAGHQFGHFVPQLGDGRAHLIGESNGFDIQLKGSGRTTFSRRGDGKSALGPVLREYIVSEAMNALGIPTTRALCAIKTGEEVYRQFGPEPGGIFTRVASSHLRVGTFQYFAARRDLKALEELLNYSIKRHYPEFSDLPLGKQKVFNFLSALIEKQSDLVALWSSVGFIHGVMNTDNFSIAGITIDYGPCAFMDEYRQNKVFSSIDQNGRYSFFNQVPIAQWNIMRLAECLLPFVNDDLKTAAGELEQKLSTEFEKFPQKRTLALAKKFGFKDVSVDDESIVMDFLSYLEKESLDFTLSFSRLDQIESGSSEYFPENDQFSHLKKRLVDRGLNSKNTKNPICIPRNHMVEKVIEKAYENDFSFFKDMLKAVTKPYEIQSSLDSFYLPPKKEERVFQTFCGT